MSEAPGWRLGRLWGVDICLDPSLLLVFLLVSFTLAAGTLPAWHPDWSSVLNIVVALAAATAFFASVLAHELSHAVVGRWLGVPVRSITLFLFGGLAATDRDASSPRTELLMTIVGPLMSLAIGFAALGGLTLLAPDMALAASDPDAYVRSLGPVASVLLWLGPLNVLLAIFNLIPGFPLDGGRVLRALLWWGSTSQILEDTPLRKGSPSRSKPSLTR